MLVKSQRQDCRKDPQEYPVHGHSVQANGTFWDGLSGADGQPPPTWPGTGFNGGMNSMVLWMW